MKPRVLIVDDEDMVSRVLAAFLSRRGFEVKTAASAEEALELVGREKFGVILLDNSLPGMTGMRAIEGLRAVGAAVILMTGHLDEETRKDGLMLGAAQVVGKPLDFDSLVAMVTRAAGGPQI